MIQAAGTSFIELGKAGDLWLGGDDIDSRIVKFVKEQVSKQERIIDIDGLIAKMPHYQRVRFNADLKVAVERAKVELSNATVSQIAPATQLLDELGIAIPIEVTITREQFEGMISDLIERSIQICRQALEDAEHHIEMVDVVLLVGGSSQIPIVQRKVREAFGTNKVLVHPRPMYAVAEGAAIVASGQTDKVTTVSRDYYIKLVDAQYKVISQGDILPVTTSHTFKTSADGQRLIHFKFFNSNKNGYFESIGDMWLGLNHYYPQGTEILVNLEVDEKTSVLGMTATLKNDPSERVSCTFSRGKADETIYKELEEAIAELNNQNLTDFGVEEALKLALPVVQLSNQIIDSRTGEERVDLRDRATTNLKKFRVSMSKERLDAEFLVKECDRVIKLCGSIIPQPQQERLTKLSQELQNAINANDLSRMEFLGEDAKRELNNLPDEVQLVQACILAIHQAHAVAPTQANAMSEKLSRMLSAIESGDGHEADRLWRELQPDVQRWLNEESTGKTIATGLTR